MWLIGRAPLMEVAGADHIVVGTDYPFDMGERGPAGVLDRRLLSPEERNLIESATAAKLPRLTT